jgi:hypothetical protein
MQMIDVNVIYLRILSGDLNAESAPAGDLGVAGGFASWLRPNAMGAQRRLLQPLVQESGREPQSAQLVPHLFDNHLAPIAGRNNAAFSGCVSA